MVFPCPVLQHRMARFCAQPEGPGLFLCEAALLVAYLEQPNHAPRALPRAKTDSGAATNETATDPNEPTRDNDGPENPAGDD